MTNSSWFRARANGLYWAARNGTAWLGKVLEPGWTKFQRQLALRRDRRKSFRYDLTVGAIFRNEAPYIDEWLTLHRGVGVEHFYLYNNNSTDNFREVLAPWIEKGLVTLFEWPGGGGQISAYNHCIRRHRMEARWIAFLDLDEFLFSPEERDLRKVLRRYEGVPAIFVYWVLFGSGGNEKHPEGSVIENYRRCLDLETARSDDFDHRDAHTEKELYVTGWAKDGKSIANPRLIKDYYVHRPLEVWTGETVDENRRPPLQRVTGRAEITCSALRINHYWSKSIEDLTTKVMRGNANWRNTPSLVLDRWLLRESFLNRTTDETLLAIWRDIQGKESLDSCSR